MNVIDKRRLPNSGNLGDKFGELTVLGREGSDAVGRILFRCKCRCGRECIVRGADLRSGHTKSCGCLRRILKRFGKVAATTFPAGFVLGKAYEEHGIKARSQW